MGVPDLAEFLMRLGFPNREARCLAVVATMSSCTAQDIIAATQLKRGKISTAAARLRDQGYITMEMRRMRAKVRPCIVFTLNKDAFAAVLVQHRQSWDARFDEALRYTQATSAPLLTS